MIVRFVNARLRQRRLQPRFADHESGSNLARQVVRRPHRTGDNLRWMGLDAHGNKF